MKHSAIFPRNLYIYLYTLITLSIVLVAPVMLPSHTGTTGVASGTLYAKEATIKEFYAILSSSETTSIEPRIKAILNRNWKNTPETTQFKPNVSERENFIEQIKTIHTIIPNMKWQPIKIIKAKNTYTVISKASGTPEDVFFNVPPSGKSFEILTIDVHTIVGGKIRESYHLEDWVNAISQLTSED